MAEDTPDNFSVGFFILKIKKLFNVSRLVEITVELNPDDSSTEYLNELKEIEVNRASLGIQSFIEEDLNLMKRAHSSDQPINCCKNLFLKTFISENILGL